MELDSSKIIKHVIDSVDLALDLNIKNVDLPGYFKKLYHIGPKELTEEAASALNEMNNVANFMLEQIIEETATSGDQKAARDMIMAEFKEAYEEDDIEWIM